MDQNRALILDAVADLVVRRDAEGRIIYVNAAFRRALGGELADWIGRWFALPAFAAAAAPGGRRRFDAPLDTVAGPASYEWEETPLAGGGSILVGRDVSTARSRVSALESAKADAIARADAKQELFAAVTHELRTPLNGVLGLAKLLDATPLNPEQRDYVRAIEESGRHLLGLVEDMLDAAKLAVGDATLAVHEVELRALVESVTGLVAPRARDKGLEIAAFIDPVAPRRVFADAGRLRQVLLNLLANAVKFTDAGGVALSLKVEQADQASARLRFEVADTGPGVSEADRARIFDAYTQGDLSAARKKEGAGLGLSIARGIVEAMRGEIGLESVVGAGSVFHVTVTLGVSVPADPAAGRALQGERLVVAAPEPLTRATLRAQLAALGADVAAASDVASLTSLLAADPDRLAIVDEALAGAAAGWIARTRAALVLIAPDQRAALGDRLKAGYAGWLVKPCRLESLQDRVARAWRGERSEGSGEVPEAPRAEAAVSPTAEVAPVMPARVLLVEDNPVNRLLAMALLKRLGVAAEAVETGEAALEWVKSRRFDLVFMDMRLPGMDGLETTRRIRAAEQGGRRTPVVALTANATAADKCACLAAGMDDFLVKPVDQDGLAAVIVRWTQREAQSKLRA
jgi:signal transduction histidine kinase/CheY-like chemotaxis protein